MGSCPDTDIDPNLDTKEKIFNNEIIRWQSLQNAICLVYILL